MVDLKNQCIILRNETVPIEKWEVWFMTPFGVCEDFKTAKERVATNDLDPDTCIVPVPVAISGRHYEIVNR